MIIARNVHARATRLAYFLIPQRRMREASQISCSKKKKKKKEIFSKKVTRNLEINFSYRIVSKILTRKGKNSEN